jgi:hypothetical protein
VMKTGITLAKPAGDRNIFSLSDGGESLPRLPKGRRISGQVSFVTNRTATAPCEGSLRTNMYNSMKSGFSGSLGICAKILRPSGKGYASHA